MKLVIDIPEEDYIRLRDEGMFGNVTTFKRAVREGIPLSSSEKPDKSKTVLYSGDGYADGYMVYDMAKCPNCGYEYEDGDKDWGLPFCPNCGQSLNWESEESE